MGCCPFSNKKNEIKNNQNNQKENRSKYKRNKKSNKTFKKDTKNEKDYKKKYKNEKDYKKNYKIEKDNNINYKTETERKLISNYKKESERDYNKNKKEHQFINNDNDNLCTEKKLINDINEKITNTDDTLISSKTDEKNKNEKFEEKKIFKRKKKSNQNEEKKINAQNKNSINNKNSLDKEKEVLNKNIKELEEKISFIEKEKEKINSQCEDLKAKNKEIEENMRKENEELQNKIFSLKKEYKDIKEQNLLLQKRSETLENKNIELKDKDVQTQKDIEALQNKNKQMEEKYKLLEKENKKIYEENLLLKKIPILVGLNNIGATCYMNATLQCLSNTDELTKYFLNKFKFDDTDNNKIISNAYHNVIKNLWNRENNNKSFSPNEFKEKLSQENPLFAGVAANDSKDLINFLLERFHNELNIKKDNNQNYISNEFTNIDQLNEQRMLDIFANEFKMKYNSIISNLFYGTLETKTQCQICKQIKYNFQIFSFIEFPLEKVNQYCFNTGKRNNYNTFNNKNPDIDLYECFEYNNNFELMTGENQMYCNICNCSSDSLYGSILYSTPNYLIINLNRGRGAVYECNVNFPEQLNLFNYVSFKMGNTVYELYAVICHIGPSSMSGHFIAFCKNRIDKKWYKYNDAFVTLCQNPNEYRSGMPYILFYKVLLYS